MPPFNWKDYLTNGTMLIIVLPFDNRKKNYLDLKGK